MWPWRKKSFIPLGKCLAPAFDQNNSILMERPAVHPLASWTPNIAEDLFSLFVGKKVGIDVARDYYLCAFDSRYIIKVERLMGSFQNIKEWQCWQAIQNSRYRNLFAPCKSISPNGFVLVQERTSPMLPGIEIPYDFSMFDEIDYDNFGVIDGRVVAHNYALTGLLEKVLNSP